jgi:uncharacterized membrane protein
MSAIRLSHVLSGAAAALLPLLLVSNCGTEVPTSPAVPTIETAAGGGPGVTVRSTVPSASPRDTSISVQVLGSGFDRGSRTVWALAGDTAVATTKIRVDSTTFVSPHELIADVTIGAEAALDRYDVQVVASNGKKGIGIELFEVTVNMTALPNLSAQGVGGARGINDAGMVVGSNWANDHLYAVRWTKRGRTWTIEKLPANTNDSLAAVANDIADDGTIVGHRFHLNTDDQRPRATVWPVSGGIVDIGPGVPLGVNPQGTVVGARADNDNSGGQGIRAVVWNRTSGRTWAPGLLLPRLPGWHSTQALGINPPGNIIAGQAYDAEDIGYAVKWVLVGGQWQGPIRLDNVAESYATLVNASGDIAGGGFPCGNRQDCQPQAMFWPAHGSRSDLGTLGVFLSVDTPIGLSNSGEVVGLALTPDFEEYAYIWRPSSGTVVNLGHLIGDEFSVATDINGHHQVVGSSGGPNGGHAIVWTPR